MICHLGVEIELQGGDRARVVGAVADHERVALLDGLVALEDLLEHLVATALAEEVGDLVGTASDQIRRLVVQIEALTDEFGARIGLVRPANHRTEAPDVTEATRQKFHHAERHDGSPCPRLERCEVQVARQSTAFAEERRRA